MDYHWSDLDPIGLLHHNLTVTMRTSPAGLGPEVGVVTKVSANHCGLLYSLYFEQAIEGEGGRDA